jgi:DNA-directed RNA polymerase specialized sigma24 family protein
MDKPTYEAALARLPEAYARALQSTSSGVPTDEICDQLGIEPEGLEPLLDLAHRKLNSELTRPAAEN